MTFKEAYAKAMSNETFRRHDEKVKAHKYTACMLFTPNGEETFYYGFDGCEICKGKHSKKRADYLIKMDMVLDLSKSGI